MIAQSIQRIIGALVIVLLTAPFLLIQRPASAHPPALKDPCALDPNNLINNGSMGPERGTAHGIVADGWDSFVIEGSPRFAWVGNEQIDPNGSTQIVSTGTFDAGMFQTVRNLQPGMYYWFRLGYSLAAKSYSGPNVRVSSIGRKVGVDPFGGADPKSPNVIWGSDLFDGNAALNRPEMEMTFAARAPNVTIFLRAMAREGGNGENRVWFDAVCMEARPDMPTATPLAPTATTIPPTATVRPTNTRPPATRVAQAPATEAPPTVAPTSTPAPTPTETPPPTATPRFARPAPIAAPTPGMDLGVGAVIGIAGVLLAGALVFFGLGFVWWRRVS
ncbi:MAG: hypothetical protein HY868_00545 [Chloroflexi bacterium]|nr:hypothetical protein [Chloroflexota bacterium]